MNNDEKSFDKYEDIDYSSIDRKADLGFRWNSISLTFLIQ